MLPKEEGVAEAARCWSRGFNCAESVLRGVCRAQGIELTDQAMRMATPFGGGVGRSEDICGALAGGVMAIGAAIGRTEAEDDRLRSYEAAGKLHKSFCEEFGSSQCRVLNKSDFKSPEHRVRCGRFVEGATRITLQILREEQS
jgi:C_GCAxxG_C_C family probable redox protein